ncbi:MAG: methyltransferase domain-containing protein [Proteobacteria bacterium]|nr:methyltransferase domain-containing protein [Pseudomonadota bacterium]
MAKTHLIFDRLAYRRHRDRASVYLHQTDHLLKEAADRMLERLLEDPQVKLGSVLEIGSRSGYIEKALRQERPVGTYLASDLSLAMLRKNPSASVVFDEELVPFSGPQFDTIISLLNMHFVNDIPGALAQLRRTLKPGGLFICSMLGGDTLRELRHAIIETEASLSPIIYPRVSPYTEVKDAGSLLQRTGYALPVTDTDTVTVLYKNPLSLMKDLQRMGESNALLERNKHFTSRHTLQSIAETYTRLYANSEGEIPATFEIITLTGWNP